MLNEDKIDFTEGGYYRLYTPVGIGILLVILVILGFASAGKGALMVVPGIIGLFGVIAFLIMNARQPVLSLKIIITMAFLINGIVRIVPIPLGLSVDGLIILTWLMVFGQSYKGVDFSPMKNLFVRCFGIWAIYCFLELFNPESRSALAWFYASRGMAFYAIMLLPLIFLFFNKRKDAQWFIYLWFGMSIFLGLYGAKQFWVGVFGFEQRWLDDFGHVTHVLWEGLPECSLFFQTQINSESHKHMQP